MRLREKGNWDGMMNLFATLMFSPVTVLWWWLPKLLVLSSKTSGVLNDQRRKNIPICLWSRTYYYILCCRFAYLRFDTRKSPFQIRVIQIYLPFSCWTSLISRDCRVHLRTSHISLSFPSYLLLRIFRSPAGRRSTCVIAVNKRSNLQCKDIH